MTKKMLRRIIAIIVALILAAGTCVSVFAESTEYVPYDSYTYWDDINGMGRKLVYNRPMFDTEVVFTAKDLGVNEFVELVDICTDKNENVYLLDRDSRIIALDSTFKVIKEITEITDGDEKLTFAGAKNIYVHTNDTIYICDTENKRVLHADADGKLLDVFVLPESPLIPEDFNYRPIKVVADSRGYVYILSEGSYYGALLYDPDKKFIGFYGANTVTNNILGAIQSLFNRMFPNNAKKGNDERTLPFAFSDIVIDEADFIYTATESVNKAHIKKLNPGAGNNILDSDDVSFTDEGWNNTYLDGGWLNQSITGLEIQDGFIYCLDSTFGRVLVYDADCRMITAFGGGMGNGTQKGTFMSASALTVKGTDILVSDRLSNTITVFTRNEYAEKVFACDKMTIEGDYLESKAGWEEILQEDKNLQIAYMGLARAYLAEDRYEDAMEMALEGYDRDTYALAYEYHRNDWISENFTWMFVIVAVLLVILIAVLVISSKKKKASYDDEGKKPMSELKLMINTFFHPGQSFEEIKDKGRGSINLALILLALFYVTSVAQTLLGGFLFTQYDPGTFNSLWVLVQSAGLIALWVVSNWLVCTLAGGKGKIKEIIIITCYSLMPMIVGRVLWTILSNFMLPSEGSFLGILTTVALLYTFIMLVIGMLRIHDFTMTKFVGTSLLTVLMMAAIIFLIILIIMLLQQLGGFVMTIFIELLM